MYLLYAALFKTGVIIADSAYFLLAHGSPNVKKMQEQWEALIKILKDEGVQLCHFEYQSPVIGPYGKLRVLWAAAAVLVINGGAIIGRWGCAPWRRGVEKLLTPLWEGIKACGGGLLRLKA